MRTARLREHTAHSSSPKRSRLELLNILYLDFDGMRKANSQFGYEKGGDVLIRDVGQALKSLTDQPEFPHDRIAEAMSSQSSCRVLTPDPGAARAAEIERQLDALQVAATHQHLYHGASVGHAPSREVRARERHSGGRSRQWQSESTPAAAHAKDAGSQPRGGQSGSEAGEGTDGQDSSSRHPRAAGTATRDTATRFGFPRSVCPLRTDELGAARLRRRAIALTTPTRNSAIGLATGRPTFRKRKQLNLVAVLLARVVSGLTDARTLSGLATAGLHELAELSVGCQGRLSP